MHFNFHKFMSVVNKVAPVVLLAVPGGERLEPFINEVITGMGEAEQMPGASGPEKKQHVLKIVKSVVSAANAAGAHVDVAGTEQAASAGIDAVIGTLHVINGAKVVKPAA